MAVFENTLFQTLFVLVLSLFLSYYFPTLVPLDQHMELSLSCETKDEELLKENSMSTMAATQDDMMAVGSRLGEINIFSADGKLQNIFLTDFRIRELGYLSDGRTVILDLMNTVTLYTKKYKKLDVRFETLSLEEGGIGSLSVDSNDEIYVSYRKARKIQIFLPGGGKAAKEIQCDGYEPVQITNYNDVLIIQQYNKTIIIIDKRGNVMHEVSYPNEQSLCLTVSKDNLILIASVAHEEGLLSIDEYNNELKHMTTSISNFKTEKPERHWYYLQQFRSGEVAFCTPDMLYIFDLSKASPTGLLYRKVALFVSQAIKYIDLPKKDSMNTIAPTPDERMAVGSSLGGIDIISADGTLQKTAITDVVIRDLGFFSDGGTVVLDDMNIVSLYTPNYKKLDVMFETLSLEEGGIASLSVDSNDEIYVSYRKARKIQVFLPRGGKAAKEIQCDRYGSMKIISYGDILIVQQYIDTIIIMDKNGNSKHEMSEASDHYLHAAVSRSKSVLIASVRHEEGMLSIDEYTTELKHMSNFISDFKIEKPEREWYYLQQFRSGEIAFSTPDRLYIFDLSKAFTTGLLHRQAITALGHGIQYVELPKKDSMNAMIATPNDRMAVGSSLGGINIFSADGTLQKTVITDVVIHDLGFFSHGQTVVLDDMNILSLYTPKYQKFDVKFETLSLEEGGIGYLSVDSNDHIYVSYEKAQKIQVFSPAGGKAIREIPFHGYEPCQITSYNDVLIVQQYRNEIIIIDKMGNIMHKLTKATDYALHADISNSNSVLIASVRYEEGWLSIDEYNNELKHMTTLIYDFKIEKPERDWYYLQQFRSGEIAFSTPDRLYIFDQSKASTTGLLHRQAVTALGEGIKYVELPQKDSMNSMTATPDDMMAVGSSFGGIDIFSADGLLLKTVLKDVIILEAAILSDGKYVLLDDMNTVSLYTPSYKKLDVMFETLSLEEGEIGSLSVDSINDEIYVAYRKAHIIQVFLCGGKAIREIPCDGYEPFPIIILKDVFIIEQYSNAVIIIDNNGNIKHQLSEPNDNHHLYAAVSNSNSVLIASVRHEEGLLNIDEYTTELKHMETLISDFKIEKPERSWYYLQQFRSGEIAFCTSDILYIFNMSKASSSGLLHRQIIVPISRGINYVELPKKDDITAMTATPDGKMAVWTYCQGIDIFSSDGKLLNTVLKDVIILEVAFLSDGQYVLLGDMNTVSLYTPKYKKLDVMFETLSFEEGGCCSISVDSSDQIYVAYRKAQKIQVFSSAGGKAIREIPCDGYVPWTITCYRDLLIVHQYSSVIITIDKEGNIEHKAAGPAGKYLYGAVSNDNTILLARMNHEEGLLNIDECTSELIFIKTLISDYKVERSETDSYHFQIFRTGEIVFSTGYRLYIFNLSVIAPKTGLLHRHVLKSVSKGITYVYFHNQYRVLAVAVTPDNRMAVGYYEGGIDIFSADGQLQDRLLRYVMVLGLGFLSDGRCVVLDITNTITLYTSDYKQLDVRFETISHDEGSYGSLAVSSDDKIYVGYVKAPKIQVFLPSGGKAILEIPCDGYPIQITCYGDILIVKQIDESMVTMDKKGYIKDKLPSNSLYGAVSKENTILLAHVDHEEGLLSVDEYTKELTPIKTLISDYMIENLETRWSYIYLQQFRSGEIAFFTRDRLYIFDLSKASTADLLHSQVVMSLSQGIKYVDLPKKDSMNIMAVTPDGRMAVGSNFGGIHIFYADGQLQHTLLRYVKVSGLGFLSSGRCVVLDDMNTITLYTKEYQKMDVKFETLSDEEGGIDEVTVDSDDQVYVGYRKAKKIQVFSPEGGKAIREIPCDGYEPMQITSYNEFLIVKQYNNTVIIIDKKGNINHELTKPSDHYLHACVSNNHSVLIASVRHEEGLLSIDEYTTELKHMTILIADFKIEKPGRGWYYLQQFRSGEIAFSTADRLYVFNPSKASPADLLHGQAVTALGQGIKYVELPKKNSMNVMAATPDGRMGVGSGFGGINIFCADGKLRKISLKDVRTLDLGFLKDGRYVVLDVMNTIRLYTPNFKLTDVRFETLTEEEGGIGGLTVDSTDQIYISYNKAQKIQIFSPAGGKAIREIPCDGYRPMQITSCNDVLIVKKYNNAVIIIDKKGNINHELTKPSDHYLHACVSNNHSVLIASVRHEEGLLSIDEYTTELKHMTTLISDFKIEKPGRGWYYLQQFRSGEIAFSTADRLYVFNPSKASPTDLLPRQAVTALGQGIKYVEMPKKDSMNAMAATLDGKMVVGSWFGGINIFYADGKLQKISLQDVGTHDLGFLKDGRYVVLDVMNTIRLYTPNFEEIDVRFETLTVEEGGIGGITVDSSDLIYVSYRKAEKIQVFSPAGGKTIREIPCDGYVPNQITSYDDVLIVAGNASRIMIIDKKGNIKHKLTKPSNHHLYAAVSQGSSVLIASVKHEEGLMNIDEYTTELKHMTTLIADFKIEKPERGWYYLQQFRSGEIAFCTPDRLYIFDQSKITVMPVD